MNPRKFLEEKSALLTALVGQVQSCRYTLDAIRRLEAMSPLGEDGEVRHLEEMLEDLSGLVTGLRDEVDRKVMP
jgi:hypothetical protein